MRSIAASRRPSSSPARALAIELAPSGVRVNCIAPGNTATPMNEDIRTKPELKPFLDAMTARTPSGRTYSEPEDMAAIAAFLASDEARAMHGAVVLADEGFSAGIFRRMRQSKTSELSVTEAVVVTGGADSVGRVIAERCLARGDKVHICDVRGMRSTRRSRRIPGMTGTVADVGSYDAVRSVFENAAAAIGDLTVLVNNVGVAGPRAAIEDIALAGLGGLPADQSQRHVFCIQRAIPMMKRQGGGAIVNFSTGSTRPRLLNRLPYVVSKFGVEGLTLNAARELGPFGIRCNAIFPGMINNARMRGIVAAKARESGRTVAEVEADYLKHISMHVQIQPAELPTWRCSCARRLALRSRANRSPSAAIWNGRNDELQGDSDMRGDGQRSVESAGILRCR